MRRTSMLCVCPMILGLTLITGSVALGSAGPAYKETVVKDGGTISGVVRLAGNASGIVGLKIDKDEAVCGKASSPPRLILGKNKGVKNAIVWLEGIKAGKRFKTGTRFVLNQNHCEYEPHVMILPLGHSLEIVNSDPVLHNVHAYEGSRQPRTIFNIAQPIRGQRTTVDAKRFDGPGILEATCDAGHPWMSAYIAVADNPYFAITDSEGRFQLGDVPPGAYKITMWHEGVSITRTQVENGRVSRYYFEAPYEVTREITVDAHRNATADFELKLR